MSSWKCYNPRGDTQKVHFYDFQFYNLVNILIGKKKKITVIE